MNRSGLGNRGGGWVWGGVSVWFCVQGVMAQEGAITGEVAELRRQVKHLSSALAAARIESDARSSIQGARAMTGFEGSMEDGGGRRIPENVRVADSNIELRMVVLGSGRRQGVVPGRVFAVMRAGRRGWRVRGGVVRPAVAGAVLEELVRGFFPVGGARVILEGRGDWG